MNVKVFIPKSLHPYIDKLIEQMPLDAADEVKAHTLRSLPFILAGAVTATVCALYALMFKGVENAVLRLLGKNELWIFLLSPAGFVLGWWVVYRFAPAAGGSGIPQVLAAIREEACEGTKARTIIGLRVAAVKILSSIVILLGGGAAGREGPSIQISAAIFARIRELWKRLGQVPSPRSMLVAGGAGGLAAAFNTPLGGIIYAIEELAKEHVSNFRLGLLEAVITAGLMAQLILGTYLYLGFPKIPVFKGSYFFVVVLTAVLSGWLGAVFGRLLYWGLSRRRRMPVKKQFALTLAAGITMAVIIYFSGAVAVGSGRVVINTVLFQKTDVGILDFLSRFFGPLLTSFSGAAGGVFAPALATGAVIGKWVAQLSQSPAGNILSICGMIGFLTGLTRTPVTAFVLILEMTDRHSAIFPMMLSALTGQLAARLADKESYYEKASRDFLKASVAQESSEIPAKPIA